MKPPEEQNPAAALCAAGIEPNEAEAEARWIMEFTSDPAEIAEILRRRARREPLQYIFGEADFRLLTLHVTPATLIPRPETEELVDHLLKFLPHGGRLLDLGTGSGAILLAALTERPDLSGVGVDLSPDALAVAERNCAKYHVERACFHQSDLFSALRGETFDLIAANLPYVTEKEWQNLDPEVRDFEPRSALTAPDDGCGLMEKALAEAKEFLRPGGRILLELDPAQARRIAAFAENSGYCAVRIIPDMTRRERFVSADVPK